MKAIKEILFGISLILLGFFCVYVSIVTPWPFGRYLRYLIFAGLLFSVIGLGFAISGVAETEWKD